ncbi:hypothetical protein J6590_047968 [Homalodisca vitripennis]|nr:hypothetical protein J6590_047968 [Homalodisca vitripennis]
MVPSLDFNGMARTSHLTSISSQWPNHDHGGAVWLPNLSARVSTFADGSLGYIKPNYPPMGPPNRWTVIFGHLR